MASKRSASSSDTVNITTCVEGSSSLIARAASMSGSSLRTAWIARRNNAWSSAIRTRIDSASGIELGLVLDHAVATGGAPVDDRRAHRLGVGEQQEIQLAFAELDDGLLRGDR